MSWATFSWNLLSAGTLNLLPAAKVSQLSLPGSLTVRAPATTCMTSALAVPNSYSPGAITPTVAGPSLISKPMDLTVPLKYSLTLNMRASQEGKKRGPQYAEDALARHLCRWGSMGSL
ncbi:hypothetical protein D9M71_614500 [compost metagenome]